MVESLVGKTFSKGLEKLGGILRAGVGLGSLESKTKWGQGVGQDLLP